MCLLARLYLIDHALGIEIIINPGAGLCGVAHCRQCVANGEDVVIYIRTEVRDSHSVGLDVHELRRIVGVHVWGESIYGICLRRVHGFGDDDSRCCYSAVYDSYLLLRIVLDNGKDVERGSAVWQIHLELRAGTHI